MGFTLDVSISAVTVFLQGLLSFFSPCVLPLLPLYIGYLSGGTAVKGEDGKIHYKQSKVLVHTLFFVAGVSFAFFLLGLGVSAVGGFFHSNQAMFARVGGILVMLFGLYQLGIFGTSSVLGRNATFSVSAGPPCHVSGYCPAHGLYLQLCLDALCGTGSYKRPSDGRFRGDQITGLWPDWRLYAGLCAAVSVCGAFYHPASGTV